MARTPARPPRIERLPRHFPLSEANGAKPTKAAIWRRFTWPSSGNWANNRSAVLGPTPGAVRNNASCSFHVSDAATHAANCFSSRAISFPKKAITRSTLLRNAGSDACQTRALGGSLDGELLLTRHPGRQLLAFGLRPGPQLRPHPRSEQRQCVRVERVGLG